MTRRGALPSFERTIVMLSRVVELLATGRSAREATCLAWIGLATSACHEEVRWALYRSWIGLPPSQPAFGGYQVPEHAGWVRIVSPRFIRRAHESGLQVQVWTVDERAEMERFLAWGVDALISNRPDLAAAVRDEFIGAGAPLPAPA